MADLGKKRTGLSEREALLDMKGTERYLLERYRSALERGGSTRVRACLVAGFDKNRRAQHASSEAGGKRERNHKKGFGISFVGKRFQEDVIKPEKM